MIAAVVLALMPDPAFAFRTGAFLAALLPVCSCGVVPIAKAMTDNVLIAFEMNGGPLHPMNGAPLRLVVPGWPTGIAIVPPGLSCSINAGGIWVAAAVTMMPS